MNTNLGKPLLHLTVLLTAILSALVWHVTACAGVFSVTPVRIYIAPKDRAVAITLNNDGDTDLVLQADIYAWSQKPDGTDDLQLTDYLLLAPPIIKLAPKARQVVRLAMLAPRDPARQMTYRMILREVPPLVKPQNNIQVPIALALNMPVFVTPPGAKREIACETGRDSHVIQAACSNTGTAYAQIREILLKRGDKQLARFEGGDYLLPGARKNIVLKASEPAASGPAQLIVTFDDFQSQTFNVSIP